MPVGARLVLLTGGCELLVGFSCHLIKMEGDEYEHESECEDYADYGVDGYHPVVLGTQLVT